MAAFKRIVKRLALLPPVAKTEASVWKAPVANKATCVAKNAAETDKHANSVDASANARPKKPFVVTLAWENAARALKFATFRNVSLPASIVSPIAFADPTNTANQRLKNVSRKRKLPFANIDHRRKR